MLRKASWTVLGIAGLSVLMCGGCSAEAQSGGAGASATPQATSQAGAARGRQAGGQGLPAGDAAELWSTVAELRSEVSQLRQEVTRLRAQVAGTGGSGAAAGTGDARGGTARGGTAQGTGGSGAAGTAQGTGGAGVAGSAQGSGAQGDNAGTGGSGAAGPGARSAPVVSDVPPAGSNVPSPQGTQVVNAVYTGEVRSVSAKQVVIAMEAGAPLVLDVDEGTRILRDGRSIGVRQLEKGEQVRAVVDLVGQDQTLEIAVLPGATQGG